jgi:hypothetical protein
VKRIFDLPQKSKKTLIALAKKLIFHSLREPMTSKSNAEIRISLTKDENLILLRSFKSD